MGRSFSKEGKKAKIVKGRAKASEKANIVTMGTQNSPAVERIRTLPTIGPVQENDTNTSVRAMKKIPIKPPLSACRSLLLTIQLGSVISKAPKNDAAIILITRLVGGDAVTADIFNWLATHWLPNLILFIVFMIFAAMGSV